MLSAQHSENKGDLLFCTNWRYKVVDSTAHKKIKFFLVHHQASAVDEQEKTRKKRINKFWVKKPDLIVADLV